MLRVFLIVLLIISPLLSKVLFSQIEIEAKESSFTSISAWGDGYLSVERESLSGASGKNRILRFLKKNGSESWNVSVEPFNFKVASVCEKSSKYAYVVNLAFDKTAIAEKTSKTEFLRIFQVSQTGNVETKSIEYTGDLARIAESEKLNQLNTAYLGAYKNGIIGVFSDVKKYDELTPRVYHIVKIDEDFNVQYTQETFFEPWELVKKNLTSKAEFVLGENTFSIYQLRLEGKELVVDSRSFEIGDLTKAMKSESRIAISKYTIDVYKDTPLNLRDKQNNKDLTKKSNEYRDEYHEVVKGESTSPTLGYFAHAYSLTDSIRVCLFYQNELKSGSFKTKEGYAIYSLPLKGDIKIAKADQEITFSHEKSGSEQIGIYQNANKEIVVLSKASSKEVLVKTSAGKKKTINCKEGISTGLGMYLLKSESSEEIYEVVQSGNRLIGLSGKGMRNGLLEYKTVLLYEY